MSLWRVRDRDASVAAELRDGSLPGWSCQQFWPGRPLLHGAGKPGGVGHFGKEIRSYKGPPSLALTEHWNYHDAKDFFGGYCYMSQGPLPQLWANTLSGARGLWGDRLMTAMADYNHQVGLKIVGEMMPQERNRVTLADDKDQVRPADRAG